MKIHKHELTIEAGFFEVKTHSLRQTLSVGEQDGKLMLWEKVVPDSNPTTLRVFIGYTGYDVHPDATTFIGTVQIGWLVLHVFEAPHF